MSLNDEIERTASLRADRDRLAAEVERLTSSNESMSASRDDWHHVADYRSAEIVRLMHERDAAIAQRDAAVAERDIAVMNVTAMKNALDHRPTADVLFQALRERDSAVDDTAEAIAVWAESTGKFGTADGIRAGAWRGQNGGG